MTDFLGLLPKPVMLGLLLYLGVCWGLADTFAARIAAKRHVPACVSGLEAKTASAEHGVLRQKEIARQLLSELLRQVPELDRLPGMRALGQLGLGHASSDRSENRLARCQCLAGAARKETALDHTLWVATMKLYEPTGVSQFHGVMARLDRQGVCGKEERP